MLFNTRLLQDGLDAKFEESYQQMLLRPHLAELNELTTEVPSNKTDETYAWLGDIPLVREWIGDKNAGSMKDYSYTVKNKDFYTAFAIDRNELEDSQIDAILPRVEMAALAASEFRWDLIADLIRLGTSGLAFDGVAFFSDITGARLFDNLLGGTGTTLAQVQTDIASARAAAMRFASENGKKLGIRLDTIVCPPEMEKTIIEAVTASGVIINGQGTVVNPVTRWIKRIITLPELTDANDYYLFSTQYPLKPFLYQNRKEATTVLDDTEVKRNRKLTYSAEMRGNVGYGFPQLAVKIVNT